MKRSIILLILISFLSIATTAQHHYVPKIFVGGKAGMTMSKVSFSPDVKQSMLMGYMGGVTFKYTEENHFGLIAEVNIEQRGWQENFEEASFEYSRTLTYVQIPLLTHIYFGSSKFKGFFNLGPEFGYLIGESTSANFDYSNPTKLTGFPTNRMTEQLNLPVQHKFDYGISVGAGAEYIIKRRHAISLEARLFYGLGNIYPDSKRDTFSASRSMSIMATLGYSFRVK